MTLTASRGRGTGQVIVRTTYGPVTNEVNEDRGHVRSFHTQLGQLLDQLDAELATDPA